MESRWRRFRVPMLASLMRPTATADPGQVTLSPRLYSADLAPTRAAKRTWGRYSLFALWTNACNMANYSFAIGLFALGMSGAQILAAFALGALVIYGLMNLSGYMGQKTGLPYPVMCRISFGIHGAQIPALIRAVIAIAWFGIQTYLASVVLRVLLTAIAPDLKAYDQNSILGLSSLGWVTLGIWCVQVAIFAWHGNGAPLRVVGRADHSGRLRQPGRLDVLAQRLVDRLVQRQCPDRFCHVAESARCCAVGLAVRHHDSQLL